MQGGKWATMGSPCDSPQHPLLSSSGIFEYQDRPQQDSAWRTAYLAALGASAAGGLYALFSKYVMSQCCTSLFGTVGYLFAESIKYA